MNRDTDELLESIGEDLEILLKKQRDALTSDEIEEISAVKIKHISDNMRSILDYIAVKVIEKTGIVYKRNIYFPYGKDIGLLESRNTWMRELKTINIDLYDMIINHQDFSLPTEKRWIIQLCNLSIKVKHNTLERPIRKDSGKTTTVDGLFRVEGDGELHIGNMNIMGSDGIVRRTSDFRVGPKVKHKDVAKKSNEVGLNSTLTYSDVKFITSNGDDIIKVFTNSLIAISKICDSAKKLL